MAAELFNVHINALQVIENELARLHSDLAAGNGDDDSTQEQIGDLVSALCRLSDTLAQAECELALENVQSK